jgi:hypothetical protein
MDPSDMQQFIAEQEAMADLERDALEDVAAEKHHKYLLYRRKKYDRIRERVLANRRLKYVPTGNPVGRPKLTREYKNTYNIINT